MKKRNKISSVGAIAALVIVMPFLAGCSSDADMASENLSTAAEQ